MGSRFVTAVALYGPKADPVRGFLAGVQAILAEHLGEEFRPYSLDQIHATLIILTGVPDPQTGAIVNECHLRNAGAGRPMDLERALRTLATRLRPPLSIRIGGHGRDAAVPFLSRGEHLFERAFSVREGDALVLVGWPALALAGPQRPLDALRRAMNDANVFHRYHHHDADVDDDFHLVVGHHAGASAGALARAVDAVRGKLAADPLDLEIGPADVKIVASDSHTLEPARFVGDLGVDEATLLALMVLPMAGAA